MDWDERLAALWGRLDEIEPNAFVAHVDRLVAELPTGSAVARFERACALDDAVIATLALLK